MVFFLNHQPSSRSLFGEVVLVGEGLGFVSPDDLATIVFPLLVRTIRNEMAHIAIVEASSNPLLALDATSVVLVEVGSCILLAPKLS